MFRRLASPGRLAVSSLLVGLVGVPVIMATRFIFAANYPEYISRRVPTISKFSAYEPASYLFTPGMTFVALCGIVAWWLVWRMNGERIATLDPAHPSRVRYLRMNHAAAAFGVLACLNLALLAIVTLRVNNDAHMVFSSIFFPSQVIAFVFDGLLAVSLARLIWVSDAGRRRPIAIKPVLAAIIVVGAAFYLFMFLNKGTDIFGDRRLRQYFYVYTEYALATMLLTYPAFYYGQLRRHFGAKPAPAASPSGDAAGGGGVRSGG